jgi:hypothetical protein
MPPKARPGGPQPAKDIPGIMINVASGRQSSVNQRGMVPTRRIRLFAQRGVFEEAESVLLLLAYIRRYRAV